MGSASHITYHCIEFVDDVEVADVGVRCSHGTDLVTAQFMPQALNRQLWKNGRPWHLARRNGPVMRNRG
jgi:hypothetical protein